MHSDCVNLCDCVLLRVGAGCALNRFSEPMAIATLKESGVDIICMRVNIFDQ